MLFGVVPVSAGDGNYVLAPNTDLVITGDVGAVVRPAAFERIDATDTQVEEYESVIESVFERQTILPAPFGVVFRNTDHIMRWLQMHYLTLTEAIHLVEGRCEVRVHMRSREEASVLEDTDATSPEAAAQSEAAMELYQAISREADASVMLKRPGLQAVLSGAFLIDRSECDQFSAIVNSEARKHPALVVDQTGPWPPYDFVRMDLGS